MMTAALHHVVPGHRLALMKLRDDVLKEERVSHVTPAEGSVAINTPRAPPKQLLLGPAALAIS
jgi:hypothetical protein